MSRAYKNILKLRNNAFGVERRNNLAKEVVKDSTPLPLPVVYKDIDEEFKRWVDEDLSIAFDGERVPTIALFSNQRFSEYMQTWANVDVKKNLLLNFKTITRENNPKSGTIVGNTRNIPGERTALMRRVQVTDRAGKKYYIDYRMKQPFAVDLIYTVSIVTNKYEMLNEFNQMVNDKFKAINCYIRPNSHFMPMELNDISDESEYSIDNRQFYSQSYNIKVMAYIITEDSMEVVEHPELRFMGMEGETAKTSYAEIDSDDLPCNFFEDSPYDYLPVNLTIHFEVCDSRYEFTMDSNFHARKINNKNVRKCRIFVNDEERPLDETLLLKPNDIVQIKGVSRYQHNEPAEVVIEGYDPTDTYKKEDGVIVKSVDFS